MIARANRTDSSMGKTTGRTISISTMALLPLCALAHHSTATYERENMLEMEAEFRSVSWANLHTRFTVSVANAAGEPELWTLDGTATICSSNLANDRLWPKADARSGRLHGAKRQTETRASSTHLA